MPYYGGGVEPLPSPRARGGDTAATWRSLTAVSALYLAQGMVAGFGMFVLIPLLQATGVDIVAHAWILASGGLPWALKILWAPALDRLAGPETGLRRRRVVIALQLLCALATGSLASATSVTDSLLAIAGVWSLINLLLALQDVAVDTLAIDTIPRRRRGLARGVMQIAALVGSGWLGSAGLARVAAQSGLASATSLLALALALLACAPLLLRRVELGRGRAAPGDAASAADRRSLRRAFALIVTDRRALLGALLALMAVIADGATGVLAYPFFMEHLKWTPEQFGTQLAPLASAVQLVGYTASALVVDRLRHARALAIGTVALGCVYASWGALDPWLADPRVLYSLITAEGLAAALLNTALLALLMDLADTRARATHFVLYMALINLSRLVLGRLLGPLPLALFGVSGAWIFLGAVQALALGPALALGLTERRRAAASS